MRGAACPAEPRVGGGGMGNGDAENEGTTTTEPGFRRNVVLRRLAGGPRPFPPSRVGSAPVPAPPSVATSRSRLGQSAVSGSDGRAGWVLAPSPGRRRHGGVEPMPRPTGTSTPMEWVRRARRAPSIPGTPAPRYGHESPRRRPPLANSRKSGEIVSSTPVSRVRQRRPAPSVSVHLHPAGSDYRGAAPGEDDPERVRWLGPVARDLAAGPALPRPLRCSPRDGLPAIESGGRVTASPSPAEPGAGWLLDQGPRPEQAFCAAVTWLTFPPPGTR